MRKRSRLLLWWFWKAYVFPFRTECPMYSYLSVLITAAYLVSAFNSPCRIRLERAFIELSNCVARAIPWHGDCSCLCVIAWNCRKDGGECSDDHQYEQDCCKCSCISFLHFWFLSYLILRFFCRILQSYHQIVRSESSLNSWRGSFLRLLLWETAVTQEKANIWGWGLPQRACWMTLWETKAFPWRSSYLIRRAHGSTGSVTGKNEKMWKNICMISFLIKILLCFDPSARGKPPAELLKIIFYSPFIWGV